MLKLFKKQHMSNTDLKPQDIIAKLIQIGSIQLSPNHPFTFASGIKSPVYCDTRLIISEVLFRDQVATTFANKIRKEYPEVEVLSGVATGSIAITALTAEKTKLSMIYTRKPKGYGHNKTFEGKLQKGQKVLVIEDAISTGTSSLQAVKQLQEAGADVVGVLVIYSHNLPEGFRNFEEAGVKYTSLCNFEDLIEFVSKNEIISSEEVLEMKKWQADPKNWTI
jgi:orotate phosphoribosyltransferase